MLVSELQNVIQAQADELDLEGTIRREKQSELPLEAGFATIISGIRRCGKSTLMQQWARSSGMSFLALNFDDLRMIDFTVSDFKVLDAIIEKTHPELLCFDEIQTVRGWELYIRQKLDAHYQCIITGSNSSMLSRELGTKLTGRHLNLELFPFSYSEYLTFTHEERNTASFEAFMKRGGFPAYLQSSRVAILQTLVEDILYRDIAVRYNIGNSDALRSLTLYLFSIMANLVSPSKLTQVFRVKSPTTMLDYFGYLEQAYLIQRLEKFDYSRRAQQLAPKKIYIADNALANACVSSFSRNDGYMLENTMFNYLRRHGSELHYFNDSLGECDFIVTGKDRQQHAYQVCLELDDGCREREIMGLLRAMKALNLRSGTIVTMAQEDYACIDGCDIHIVPACHFCK